MIKTEKELLGMTKKKISIASTGAYTMQIPKDVMEKLMREKEDVDSVSHDTKYYLKDNKFIIEMEV